MNAIHSSGRFLIAAVAMTLALAASPARAQSEASVLLSALPVASVVGAASVGAAAVSVIGTGVLLSAAGEVLAFIPNELGRALLHNERITY